MECGHKYQEGHLVREDYSGEKGRRACSLLLLETFTFTLHPTNEKNLEDCATAVRQVQEGGGARSEDKWGVLRPGEDKTVPPTQ